MTRQEPILSLSVPVCRVLAPATDRLDQTRKSAHSGHERTVMPLQLEDLDAELVASVRDLIAKYGPGGVAQALRMIEAENAQGRE